MEKLPENIGKAVSTYLSHIGSYRHIIPVAESNVINILPIDMGRNFLRCRDINLGMCKKHDFFDYAKFEN